MLRQAYAPGDQPEGVLPAAVPLSLREPEDLSPGDKRLRATGFRATQAAAARGQGVLRVLSDGRGATPLDRATIHFAQAEAIPVVGFGLRFVETGMARGGSAERRDRPATPAAEVT
jgi:hypothetical protein